eukprot:TRINITY_DN8774_c0_g1_i1.p1 TRINITY_DN8774_c0_g1~~TRINITY_DN8774_c0_g1_i1.p1  ORF type:complete len:382 (+),score=56.87 TRINITY_DN8774_c0_g1_i1:209-1354(+)
MQQRSLCILVAVYAVLCVGFSSQDMLRRMQSSDRVHDFRVSPDRDAVSWTAFGRQWNVRLELSDVVEDNMDYYYGSLAGDDKAIVSFSLLPGLGLSGMIATRNNTWWIATQLLKSAAESDVDADVGVYMIREGTFDDIKPSTRDNGQQVPPLAEPLSDAGHNEQLSDELGQVPTEQPDVSTKRSISSYKVGVFWDQQWSQASNNPWASTADTIGLFNDVNAIYRAAGMATFNAVTLKQITNSQSSLSDMLSYLSDTMQPNIAAYKDSSYTNYIWLIGSNVGGLSYVGTTCKGAASASNRKTAVAGLANWSRLWTVKTIAHELGHNRGAQHDFANQCTPSQTTNCQCSVMSYCFPSASNNPGGAINTFSATSIAQMTGAGCL